MLDRRNHGRSYAAARSFAGPIPGRPSVSLTVVILVGMVLPGCMVRTANYDFKNDTGTDYAFNEGCASYWEGEVRTPRLWDIVGFSWALGWERGVDKGTIEYSTEDATYYYPHTTDKVNAKMFDTRLTARVYPLKSIPMWDAGWRVAPYGGVGCGYFWGSVEINKQGEYLGQDIHGGSHYGLNSRSEDFSGTFWSWSAGVEIIIPKGEEAKRGWEIGNWDKSRGPSGMALVIEYRQDASKSDGNVDFDAGQVFFGFGFSW